MREKERPAKENAGKGGGNGMLNEREGKASKENAGKGGGNGMLNERKNGQQRECW